MNALQFKIRLDELEMLDWNEWKRADQERILEVAKKNHLTIEPHRSDKEAVVIKGKPENLYWFMYDVAYNYDIELI